MSSASLDRYRWTEKKTDDFVAEGRFRHSLWKPVNLMSRPELALREEDYDLYTVTEVDVGRVDMIAWKCYQDVTLWWVIARENGIRNAMTDLVAGTVIKIPKKEFVLERMEASGRA